MEKVCPYCNTEGEEIVLTSYESTRCINIFLFKPCRSHGLFYFIGKFCRKVIFIPRVTYEQAAKEFADHGYTLIDNDVMATKKMAYTCNKHPDKPPQYIDLSHLRRGHGCKYCREGRRSNHSVNKDTVIKLCEDRAF